MPIINAGNYEKEAKAARARPLEPIPAAFWGTSHADKMFKDIESEAKSLMAARKDHILSVLRLAERSGIMLCIPGYYELDAEEALLYIQNPDQCYAKINGVSVEQFLRYRERNGIPQCGATTQRGRRCKCSSANSDHCREPSDFVKVDGGYCSIHGG